LNIEREDLKKLFRKMYKMKRCGRNKEIGKIMKIKCYILMWRKKNLI
jgi:hypothetical protein